MKPTKYFKDCAVKTALKRSKPHYERVKKIVALRDLGYNNVEIGLRHRLSSERVRQELVWFKQNFKT